MDNYDYQQAMAHHAAALGHNNQLHPAMANIPMLSAAGLNLTVMPSGLGQGGQHHLGQIQGHHQIMYQNVQPAQNASHVTHHQQQQQQQNHHTNHQQQHQQGGHGGGHGGGGGGGGGGHGKANKKKPKVNKDGVPAPKRATTAYINFTQWYREELKKAGRAIPKIGDFGKECAAKWNGMPEDDKKPFLDVANKDRERYKREMQVYKPARDANKPKRPGTAFMLFMGDFRKEMAGKEPEGGVAALAKLGGERWRNMTEEDKRPYVEKQNTEKQRYEIAMEEYRRKSAGGVVLEAVMLAGVNDTGPSPAKQARLSTDASDVGSPDEHSNSEAGGGGAPNAAASQPGPGAVNAAGDKVTGESTDGAQGSESSNTSAPAPTATSKPPESGEGHPSIPIYSQQQQQIFTPTSNNNNSYGQAAPGAAGDASYGQSDPNGNNYPAHAGYTWQ